MEDADFVVVGAGAAGCVLAADLVGQGHRVTLIEAGGRDRHPLFAIPGLGFLASLDPRWNWMFRTEPVADLGGRELLLLQGRVLGGSSSINGMMYNRGNPAEYDLWRQLGCAGWAWEDVAPVFARIEQALAGGAGALAHNAAELPILEAALAGAQEAGWPLLADPTAAGQEGFGRYRTNIRAGRRQSAARVFLPAALASGRLRLVTGVQATRVVLEGGRAVAVEGRRGAAQRVFRAGREVILCAGAIKSPQLLMLSGIGPAAALEAAGIVAQVDAPQVGEGLQNHPCVRMQFTCRRGASGRAYARPLRAAAEGLRYLVARRGALAQTIYGVGGYMRSAPDREDPDIQVVLAGALMPPVSGGRPRLSRLLPRQDGFSAVIYQGTPHSHGRVGLRSADPLAPPRIETGAFRDRRDVAVLIAGIRQMRAIAATPAMRRMEVAEIAPGPAAADDAALEQAIRAGAGTAYHQCGTCAMGGQPDSVVDPSLRVRGVEGLRVADASVIPRIPNAGLHGPSMMVGARAAELIGGTARRGTGR